MYFTTSTSETFTLNNSNFDVETYICVIIASNMLVHSSYIGRINLLVNKKRFISGELPSVFSV